MLNFNIWSVADAHRKNPLAPLVSEKEIEEAIRKWLNNSSERDGGREGRRKTASPRINMDRSILITPITPESSQMPTPGDQSASPNGLLIDTDEDSYQ